ARIERLGAADLTPRAARDVVRERDPVEPGAALGDRTEGEAEGLAHRRVAIGRVLGVHVEVAGVPTRLTADGAAVVAGRPVGLVRERGIVGELDLDPPGDL